MKEYMYDTSVVKCTWCLDDVKEILEPACGHLRPTMHTNFCINVISIEYMASTVIVVAFFKIAITNFNTQDYVLFKISSSFSGSFFKCS